MFFLQFRDLSNPSKTVMFRKMNRALSGISERRLSIGNRTEEDRQKAVTATKRADMQGQGTKRTAFFASSTHFSHWTCLDKENRLM